MVQHKMYREQNTKTSPPRRCRRDDQHHNSNNNTSTTSDDTMTPQAGPAQHQRQTDFFQLTGHKECFKPGRRANTILKRATGNEQQCLMELMEDELAGFVPQVYGLVSQQDDDEHELDNNNDDGLQRQKQPLNYLEMQDLLTTFSQASVMDVKMGCRTYREQELDMASREAKLRQDMFEKMVEVDESEPTVQEREVKAVTKPRYMIWRETVSSTASLSFRIEGMRLNDGTIDKNFKTTKDEEQIAKALMRYAKSNKIRVKYLKRLYDLREALLKSKFFRTHEMIGSSLLFVHDEHEASIWMIDFAKTYLLPDETKVTHRNSWQVGNHEDGYLNGIDNLIRIFENVITCSAADNQESSSNICRISSSNKSLHKNSEENLTISNNNNSSSNKSSKSTTKHHPKQKLSSGVSNGSNGNLNGTTRFLPKLKT